LGETVARTESAQFAASLPIPETTLNESQALEERCSAILRSGSPADTWPLAGTDALTRLSAFVSSSALPVTAVFDGSPIQRFSASFSPSVVCSPSAQFSPSVLRLTAAIRASGLLSSAGFGGTRPLNTSGALTVSGRFPVSEAFAGSSPREDEKQNTHQQNIGLLAGIVGGAFLLILLAALLIWRLLRRSEDSVTSSLTSEMQTDTLGATEDIDFRAMTFDTNPVEELPNDINFAEPDESLTSVKSIVDDFL
jgi:hypothetical protein